jgi:TonB family protein
MQYTHYFLWSGIFLMAFHVFYVIFLKRETFFVLNRIYLLGTVFLSLLVPFLDLSTLVIIPKTELIISTLSVVPTDKLMSIAEHDLNLLAVIYWIGVVVTAILLLNKVYRIKRTINLPVKGVAFSFWKTKLIDPELSCSETIDAHENVHVKQLHTLDILVIEVIGIFLWFNPLIYCYRRNLKIIHEYLADEYAVKFAGSKKQYATLLFLQAFKAGPALSNSFHTATLLESRIRMLQQEKSRRYLIWKYALCIPMIVLLSTMCSFSVPDLRGNASNPTFKAAEFPGGFDAFSKYLVKTAKKVSAKNGKVMVSFIVETDGVISNAKIETSVDAASDQEALRVIRLSPRWIPAMENGRKIRSSYQIGINYMPDN